MTSSDMVRELDHVLDNVNEWVRLSSADSETLVLKLTENDRERLELACVVCEGLSDMV